MTKSKNKKIMWAQSLLVLVIALFGAESYAFEGRIVGGANTDILNYPFMVSVRGSQGWHSCGGTIVAKSWVLTAAQCVYGLNPNQLSIQYGTTVLGPASSFVMPVQHILMHENYNPSTNVNDIALLRLQGHLPFNSKTIGKVTLPKQNFETSQVPRSVAGTLIGWGLNASDGVGMHHLQAVHLKIYSDRECYNQNYHQTTRDQICAGADGGGKGQCSGDPGGPLIYKGYIQLGIVSLTHKPCGSIPGISTKVSHYVNWIHRILNAFPL